MSITPTLEQSSSPVIERTVAQWNTEYEQAQVLQNLEELDTLVQDLRDNPPTPIATLAHPADKITKEQESAPQNPYQELLTPTHATPTVFMGTVAETPRQPLLLAQRATAVPSTPTPAAKCLRPESRRRPRKEQPGTACKEITCPVCSAGDLTSTDKGGPYYSTPPLPEACLRYHMRVGTFQTLKRNCSGLPGSCGRLHCQHLCRGKPHCNE